MVMIITKIVVPIAVQIVVEVRAEVAETIAAEAAHAHVLVHVLTRRVVEAGLGLDLERGVVVVTVIGIEAIVKKKDDIEIKIDVEVRNK
jgi:hypothetical protein